jgi:hypothetical protein
MDSHGQNHTVRAFQNVASCRAGDSAYGIAYFAQRIGGTDMDVDP